MTLDEAIKHAEEVAEEKEGEAQDLEYSKLDWKYEANKCSECAKEHLQLAEWLKDYKRLLEQEPCADAISRQWLMECVNEGWIKFDTEKDKNIFIHLIRDIAPPVTSQIKTGHWIALEEWKKDFKEYVNSLSMLRDDYKGIMEYIDELPVTPQPKVGCEGCIYEKTGNNSTYPCSHCGRCYTDKYKTEGAIRDD